MLPGAPRALDRAGRRARRRGRRRRRGRPEAAELELLFVEPAAIGTGAGRALLRDALDRAREAGLDELTIESDPDAEPFYRAHGAEPVGTRVSSSTGRKLPLLRIST